MSHTQEVQSLGKSPGKDRHLSREEASSYSVITGLSLIRDFSSGAQTKSSDYLGTMSVVALKQFVRGLWMKQDCHRTEVLERGGAPTIYQLFYVLQADP